MSPALIAALIFTVVLLVTTAYFLMGSVPLLVLKHDVPMDARFVRGFFNTYYLAAMVAAGATAVSYAIAGKPAFAVGAAALVVIAIVLRRNIIARMDSLGSQIQLGGDAAVREFRNTHLTAIVINLVQLVVIVWSLTRLSLQ